MAIIDLERILGIGGSSGGSVSHSLVDGKGRWVSCCPDSAWGSSQGVISHCCPPVSRTQEVSEGMWLMALLSQSQWDFSAEEKRNVEAFGNGKTRTEEPAALQPWLCAGG